MDEPITLLTHPQGMQIGRLLFRTARKYLGVLARYLTHLDIERNFAVILLIEESGKPMSQQELADYLHVDKAAIVRMINYLTGKGILERKVNPTDHRQYMLQLTPKARKIIPDIRKAIAHVNESVFEGLSQKKQNDFLEVLIMMDARLSELPAEEYRVRVRKKKKK
jgi:DNA-binding MarR family transcriptional regulator